jgi:hypothetical protein
VRWTKAHLDNRRDSAEVRDRLLEIALTDAAAPDANLNCQLARAAVLLYDQCHVVDGQAPICRLRVVIKRPPVQPPAFCGWSGRAVRDGLDALLLRA